MSWCAQSQLLAHGRLGGHELKIKRYSCNFPRFLTVLNRVIEHEFQPMKKLLLKHVYYKSDLH